MEQTSENDIKVKVEKLLAKEVTLFSLKGKGDCNYAYYVETSDGGKYIVKLERERKETEDQNDLVVEGNVIRSLYDTGLTTPVPHIVLVSDDPKSYAYDYIEGELLRGVWGSLSQEEKIDICRSLGQFHAEIGKKFTKEMSQASGVDISESLGLRPKIIEDQYNELIVDANIPDEFKSLAKEAKRIFDGTTDKAIFQFIHNDGHPENIIIKDKRISGIIDFGDAEYGEVAKEFSRYVRDLPDHFQHILSAYEEYSGHKLCYERIVTNAMISGFVEIIEDYRRGGEGRVRAENTITMYGKLIDTAIL